MLIAKVPSKSEKLSDLGRYSTHEKSGDGWWWVEFISGFLEATNLCLKPPVPIPCVNRQRIPTRAKNVNDGDAQLKIEQKC